jgi:hypothetical protein
VVEFDNPGQTVMSGVNADITIDGGGGEPSMVIGRESLRRDGDFWIVYVAANNAAVRREVVMGRYHDVDVEILSGLAPGDSLITEGLDLVADGSKIRVLGD